MVVQNAASFNLTDRLTYLAVVKDIVTDLEFIIFEDTISSFSAGLALVGIVGNIVNISTFISMGVNEGVSLTFLFLSALDLAYLVMVVSMGVSSCSCPSRPCPATPFGFRLSLTAFTASLPCLEDIRMRLQTCPLSACLCVDLANQREGHGGHLDGHRRVHPTVDSNRHCYMRFRDEQEFEKGSRVSPKENIAWVYTSIRRNDRNLEFHTKLYGPI
ncbi:hypothetical protein Btru_005633 [Bulinus truncatus]|nr:hypothetical protein Btru_005633 [Bulinus truncatus]